MRRRNRIAWRLSVVVLLVVAAAILGAGFLSSILSRQYALDAARDIIKFNSASIRSGIKEMMMSENKAGAVEYVAEVVREGTTYRDISIISHPSGRIAFSRIAASSVELDVNDLACRHCHVGLDQPICVVEAQDEVIGEANDDRYLHVVTPILNETGCRNAACHAHAESGEVLGVLVAEYSLADFDVLMKNMKLGLALAAVLAVLLAVGASLLMFRGILAKPLRRLVTGIDTLADGDFDFRFPAQKDDEIGLVEESFNDLADHIQAHQRELSKARDNLEGIVENSADLIITVNTRGFIHSFNRGAEQALGYARTEVLGKPVEMLFEDPRERDKAIARLREQDNVTNWETRFKTKDGQICNVLLTLSRLRNRRGELIGTLGISKDITKEKELQRKLIRSEQEAAIGRAVTGIQHAIKNMLNTLRGGLYIVQVGQKKNQHEHITEGCEMVEEGISRISDLSLNMLKYAREWTIEPEPTDLSDLVGKVVVAVGQTAKESGVTIGTEIDSRLPDVSCDPRLIHMSLMDIVSNALDACEMKDYQDGDVPQITIGLSTGEKGNTAVVAIRDNGIGMTQKVVNDVFTPFFSTKKKSGTGLGMALTSRIIGLHDGEIVVESEPDEGTTFRITLPFNR
jgi:PAS domain S-box-containing protein